MVETLPDNERAIVEPPARKALAFFSICWALAELFHFGGGFPRVVKTEEYPFSLSLAIISVFLLLNYRDVRYLVLLAFMQVAHIVRFTNHLKPLHTHILCQLVYLRFTRLAQTISKARPRVYLPLLFSRWLLSSSSRTFTVFTTS